MYLIQNYCCTVILIQMSYDYSIFKTERQRRRNDFGMGGGGCGGKKILRGEPRKIFFNHTFFQMDTILFISISVISNIH